MHKCIICGYIYNQQEGDSANGIAPGTHFEDIDPDWKCPLCGACHTEFEEI